MSRPLRIQYPGAWYHVTHRGAARQKIYQNEIDRLVFLHQVGETSERHAFEVHAYCLMGNHYHLLVRTPEGNLSEAMRHLNSTYSQRFNKSHGIDGPLFKGRYAAQLVGEDDYLRAVMRYIHQNPVEAGLEEKFGSYRWSSMRSYLHPPLAPAWLNTGWISSTFPTARGFLDFHYVANELEPSLVLADDTMTRTPLVVGSEAFIAEALAGSTPDIETRPSFRATQSKPTVSQIQVAVACVASCSIEDIAETQRGKTNVPKLAALCLANDLVGLKYSSLALVFGFRTYKGVASALRRADELWSADADFRSTVEQAALRITRELSTELAS